MSKKEMFYDFKSFSKENEKRIAKGLPLLCAFNVFMECPPKCKGCPGGQIFSEGWAKVSESLKKDIEQIGKDESLNNGID